MRFFLIVVWTVVLSPALASATLVTNNLSEGATGNLLVENVSWAATSFTTDNQDYTLTRVQAILDSPGSHGSVFAQIYSGTTSPGSSLGSLTVPGLTSSPTTYDLIPQSSIALAANTTYWVVFGAINGGEFLNVGTTTSVNETGPGTIGNVILASGNSGASWSSSIPGLGSVIKFSVEASAVPEPGSLTLCALAALGGLGWRTNRGRVTCSGGRRTA